MSGVLAGPSHIGALLRASPLDQPLQESEGRVCITRMHLPRDPVPGTQQVLRGQSPTTPLGLPRCPLPTYRVTGQCPTLPNP